jgi:hypothetical protein
MFNINASALYWDAASGNELRGLNNQKISEIISLGWSPDGSTLAAVYFN